MAKTHWFFPNPCPPTKPHFHHTSKSAAGSISATLLSREHTPKKRFAMDRQTYQGTVKQLKTNQIFVFGSNPEGRHGAGAAKTAKLRFGAKYGIGRGLMGHSYALVTKNLTAGYVEKTTGICYARGGVRSVSSVQIIENIRELYRTALSSPDLEFFIIYSGSREHRNLNGYTNESLASFFRDAYTEIPRNIVFEEEFNKIIFGPLQ